MKRFVIAGLIFWVTILGLNVVETLAANSVTFSDSLKQKVASYREDGDVWYDVVDSGSFKVIVKVDLSTNQLTNQFDENTCFTLTTVDRVFNEVCLGQDAKYTIGKKSAKIIQKYETETGKIVTALTTSIKWTKKHQLTFTVTGKIPYEETIIAGDYVEGETGPIGPLVDSASLLISGDFQLGERTFSELSFDFGVTFSGEVAVKTVTIGIGEDAEGFELYTVKIASESSSLREFQGPLRITLAWNNADHDLSVMLGVGDCAGDFCNVCMSDGDCDISTGTISGNGTGSEWVNIEERQPGTPFKVIASWRYDGDIMDNLGISVPATITVERGTQVLGVYEHTFQVEYKCEGGKGGDCWYVLNDWIVGNF